MSRPFTMAVLGLNYGDEGKGHVVSKVLVPGPTIKHNGGAQAGHTVLFDNGTKKFVCHQLGSRPSQPTYFAPQFMINPMLLRKEIALALESGFISQPDLSAHPACKITTRYDMMYNQVLERARGRDRHGSCGMGINATRERNKYQDYQVVTLSALEAEVLSDVSLEQRVRCIRDYYIRIARCLPGSGDEFVAALESMTVSEVAAELRMEDVKLASAPQLNSQAWVFETGQGHRLSMNNSRDFPHLTPSYTDLSNPNYLVKMWLDRPVVDRALLVTRPYVTRHGAGPLPDEVSREAFLEKFPNFVDETNSPNEWQGEFRFAFYSDKTIADRAKFVKEAKSKDKFLILTCCNHGEDSTWNEVSDLLMPIRAEASGANNFTDANHATALLVDTAKPLVYTE